MAQQLSGPFFVLMLVYAPSHACKREGCAAWGNLHWETGPSQLMFIVSGANQHLMGFSDMCVDIDLMVGASSCTTALLFWQA